MATVTQVFPGIMAELRSTAFPQLVKANGTTIPISAYAFDGTAIEEVFFGPFEAVRYGSGNLTVRVRWYADTASTGAVSWGAQIAAITPTTDTQDVETDGLATAAAAATTHLGTTGQREHQTSITVTSLDSLTAGDTVRMRIFRDPTAGGDTMAGDALLELVSVDYSDT